MAFLAPCVGYALRGTLTCSSEDRPQRLEGNVSEEGDILLRAGGEPEFRFAGRAVGR